MRRGLLDPLEPEGGLLEGGWSRSPELIDRMTMLPIGQYEDGSLTLAWPSMLKDMYEGAFRSYLAQEGPPIYDDGGQYVSGANMQPLDAFNAASIAPMAGVAGRVTGGIPRGALGSGGSDMLTKGAAPLETITGVATKYGDEIVPTTVHGYEYDEVAARLGEDVVNAMFGRNEVIPGFITSTGRFVDRAEATRITNASRPLDSSDLAPWKERGPNGEILFANDSRAALPGLLSGEGEEQGNAMRFANADPAYDADALVREQWRGLPFVQGDPSAYNAGHIDLQQFEQQRLMDPLEYWFRPQPPDPPPLFR